jgi:hypothetical protein
MSKFSIVITIFAASLATGCQQAPTQQVAATQQALEEARAAQADQYAPDEFGQAQKSFTDATDEIAAQGKAFFLTRGYTKADELLKEAQMKVQTAQTAATENKEKVKHEVETLTTETEAAIQAANAALLKAPRGKGAKAELEAMKADLDTTTTALAEARDMYSKGDYLGAKTSLTGSKQTVEKVAAEVELAMHKVKGTKKQPSPVR